MLSYFWKYNINSELRSMITQINRTVPTFKVDTHTIDAETKEYKDPLMRWPLRGCAFTNEIGESLRPLIGNAATLSWAPVLLYVGADIYDKYKNDQTEYSPSSHRCLKQAIFQGLASMFLPLLAVKLGQNIFSLTGLFTKDKLTIKSKEHIENLAKQYVTNGKLHSYINDDKECAKNFREIVSSNLDYKIQKAKTTNPIKKIYLQTKETIFDKFKVNQASDIDNYANKIITDLIDKKNNFAKPDEKFKSEPLYKKYARALKSGQTENIATNSVLNKYLAKGSLKDKAIKSLGGFAVILPAIPIIDKFVEQVLIGKYIAPRLEK